MSCGGPCTVRIYESRNLSADKWPDKIDKDTAIRVLHHVVAEDTGEQKESGCPSNNCVCTPLADYLPDESGKRKKEPEWTAWRQREVIENIGSDGEIEFVVGSVEIHSAIVPGLCEPERFIHLHLPKHGKAVPPKKE